MTDTRHGYLSYRCHGLPVSLLNLSEPTMLKLRDLDIHMMEHLAHYDALSGVSKHTNNLE
jgi:hypothetical protein